MVLEQVLTTPAFEYEKATVYVPAVVTFAKLNEEVVLGSTFPFGSFQIYTRELPAGIVITVLMSASGMTPKGGTVAPVTLTEIEVFGHTEKFVAFKFGGGNVTA